MLRDRDNPSAPLLPAPGVTDIAELVNRVRSTGLDVQLSVDGNEPSQLSDASSLAAYRIVQESLTNASRHAPGAPVTVAVTFDTETMSILVRNPRINPDHDGMADGCMTTGVGLQGMAERAATAGGVLEVGHIGDGFAVHANLPYLRAAR